MKAINDGSSSLAEKFALNVGINVSDVATAVDGGGGTGASFEIPP